MKYQLINKHLALMLLCNLFTITIFSQKYYTKTGVTSFQASVKTFEPVAAVNKSTTALLDTKTGAVASLLFIQSFKFKVALMQEHFNENYMDADKFPKATFKGTLKNFNYNLLTSKPKVFYLSGDLTIKGKTKTIKTKVYLHKSNNKIIVDSSFDIKPADFGIEIPSVVRNKIAEKVTLKLYYELKAKK